MGMWIESKVFVAKKLYIRIDGFNKEMHMVHPKDKILYTTTLQDHNKSLP